MEVLAIGPHPDDVELNCYGLLKRLKEDGYNINVLVLTDGSAGSDGVDRLKEQSKTISMLGANIFFGRLQDRYISSGYETISVIEGVVNEVKPKVVLIPSEKDTHQDHRATSLASIVACRNVDTILQYNCISSGTNHNANYYVDITEYIDEKVKAISMHKSQRGRRYMQKEVIKGRAKQIGYKIHRSGKYFEEFYLYRNIT